MLLRNYRSSAALLALPNRLFYGGALLVASSASASASTAGIGGPSSALDPPRWDAARAVSGWRRTTRSSGTQRQKRQQQGLASGDADESDAADGAPSPSRDLCSAATLFVGVRGEVVTPGAGGESAHNPTEAAVVAAVVAELCRGSGSGSGSGNDGGVLPSDVGVICLTRQQARTCRSMLRRAALGAVRAGTVDDFQGQEVDVVVVSTVAAAPPRSGPRSSSSSASSAAPAPSAASSPPAPPPLRLPGPLREALSDPRVFNVAVTRARRLLVVVGCPLALLRGSAPSSSPTASAAASSSSSSSSSSSALNPWLELLRHVAGRGAFLGSGSDELAEAVSAGAAIGVGSRDPRHFPTPSSSGGKQRSAPTRAGGGTERSSDLLQQPDLDDELSAAAARVAELAILGSGRAREMFPEELDDVEESLGGRPRLVL